MPSASPTASPTPRPRQSPDGSITVVGVPRTGFSDFWIWGRVQLTLGGPAVYDIHPVETIRTFPGKHQLTFWRNTCDFGSMCGSRALNNGVQKLCTGQVVVRPGQALYLRVNVNRPRCIRKVLPRPERLPHPSTITGQLLFGNRGCPYLLDRWGRFWDLRLPAGWYARRSSPGFSYLEIAQPDGQFVATFGDRVRVSGSRVGAHSTGCAMHEYEARGTGYLIADMSLLSSGQ